MEELKYLGEVLVFHDPSFKREYRQWIEKNQTALALCEVNRDREIINDFGSFGIELSLN
jgi:hypothetical protein